MQWQVGGQAPDGKLQAGRLGTAVCVGQPLRLCVNLSNQVYALSLSLGFTIVMRICQWQIAPEGSGYVGCICHAMALYTVQGAAAATVSASLACTTSSGDAAEAEPGTARTAVDASSSILCAGAPTGEEGARHW